MPKGKLKSPFGGYKSTLKGRTKKKSNNKIKSSRGLTGRIGAIK